MLSSCSVISNKDTIGNLPVVIDLFSGCGGLAFGFKNAGYKIVNGIDFNQEAVNTASYNLHWQDGHDKNHLCGDITEVESEIFKTDIYNKECIVIGGPPCQAYSRIGRSKLRSLGEERYYTNDKRGYLYNDFVRFAIELNAKAVIMENVLEATDYGGLNVPQTVCEMLETYGYKAYWTILNAADYGVPQVRERIFVIAVKDKNIEINAPKPTHVAIEKKMTPGMIKIKQSQNCKNFLMPLIGGDNLKPWVTVTDAIGDLPSLFPNAKSQYKLYSYNVELPYSKDKLNEYQVLMRTWNGLKLSKSTGHGFRKTVRDFPIFERMQEGDDYRKASIIAEELLEEACRAMSITSENIEEYERLRKKIVPPYSKEKFVTKWKRLNGSKPAHTLVAHLSTDTYSHLHPWEPRGITVREAARLQSFPDGFIFPCSMSHAFKQIGNAVPPLLATALANHLKTILSK